jgi:hypothetical protein
VMFFLDSPDATETPVLPITSVQSICRTARGSTHSLHETEGK